MVTPTRLALLVVFLFSTPALALDTHVLPRAERPEDVALSTERVARPATSTRDRDAAGEITIQDLLRHTSGFTYGNRGVAPVNRMYQEAKIGSRDDTNAELVTKLGGLPLLYQPGTRFEYGVSTDVLGRLVEVVSGT